MHIGLLYKIWPKSLLKVVFLLRAMSAESCVSLKGNDKAIFNSSKCYKGNGGSKKGRWLIKTYR